MKYQLLFFLLISVSLSSFSKKKDKEEKFNETYRPQYHYSVDENRMGNPISMVSVDTSQYLYFQYNPFNLIEGYYNWGHAISRNGVLWEQQDEVVEQAISIADSMQNVPWYGSVCEHEGKMYAWINRWNEGVFMTESEDGKNWGPEVKVKGTDQLVKGESYVFWYAPDQKWVMFGFDRESTTLIILNSMDGKSWETTSSFNYNFGFPQVFQLPVDRKPDEKKWVLATEEGTYVLGSFDGKEFQLKSTILKYNHGRNIGSSVFYPGNSNDEWYSMTFLAGNQLADLPSYGQLTFPSKVELKEFETGVELVQSPSEKLATLFEKEYLYEDERIYPGLKNNILKKAKGSELHLKMVIDLKTSDQFSIMIRDGRDQQGTEINYNVKKSILSFLGTRLGYVPQNEKMELEILIDRSSIELYIENGRYVVSYPFEPSPEATSYELFTVGGEINVDYLVIHPLKSIWHEK